VPCPLGDYRYRKQLKSGASLMMEVRFSAGGNGRA
jgi:hypothetical protein